MLAGPAAGRAHHAAHPFGQREIARVGRRGSRRAELAQREQWRSMRVRCQYLAASVRRERIDEILPAFGEFRPDQFRARHRARKRSLMRMEFDVQHRTGCQERSALARYMLAVVGPQSRHGSHQNPDGQHNAAIQQHALKAAEHAEFRAPGGSMFVGR